MREVIGDDALIVREALLDSDDRRRTCSGFRCRLRHKGCQAKSTGYKNFPTAAKDSASGSRRESAEPHLSDDQSGCHPPTWRCKKAVSGIPEALHALAQLRPALRHVNY